MKTFSLFFLLAFMGIAACAALSGPAAKPAPGYYNPEAAGRILDKATMEVIYSTYNDMPGGDPCNVRIEHSPFEVLAHHTSRGGLNLYWDRNTFVLEFPQSSLLMVSLFEHPSPMQTFLGPWWLAGGSVLDPVGNPWATTFDDKWRLRIPGTVFPTGLEFSLQALIDAGTSDAWRLLVR